MSPIAKLLIAGGAVLMGLGLLWHFGGTYLHLGRLPGDIVIERNHTRFYFPIVTCLVLSILLSLVIALIQWFNR